MTVEVDRREVRRWEARLAVHDPAQRARAIEEARVQGAVHRVERRLVEIALAYDEPELVGVAARSALASQGSLRAARLLRARLVELGFFERTDARDVAQLIEDRYELELGPGP